MRATPEDASAASSSVLADEPYIVTARRPHRRGGGACTPTWAQRPTWRQPIVAPYRGVHAWCSGHRQRRQGRSRPSVANPTLELSCACLVTVQGRRGRRRAWSALDPIRAHRHLRRGWRRPPRPASRLASTTRCSRRRRLVRDPRAGVNVVAPRVHHRHDRFPAATVESTPCQRGTLRVLAPGVSPGFAELVAVTSRNLQPGSQVVV